MYKNARYRSIPCLFNEETNEIIGKNWFYDKIINLNVWFDFEILGIDELPIWVEEDKNKK